MKIAPSLLISVAARRKADIPHRWAGYSIKKDGGKGNTDGISKEESASREALVYVTQSRRGV